MAVDPQSETTPLQELGQRARARAEAAELAVRDELAATRQRWDMSRTGRAVNKVADWFFGWLFDWGLGDDVTVWSPPRPPTAKEIEAATDEALARKRAAFTAPAAAQLDDNWDVSAGPAATVEGPAPSTEDATDLDAVINGVDGPPPVDAADGHTPPPLEETYDINPNWCNCTGMAHEAHCRAAAIGDFDVDDLLPPDPSGAASEPEPAVPNL